MEDSSEDADIVCSLSAWFYRRTGLALALIFGLGLYFLYDGSIGYPKKNFTVDLHDAFLAGRGGRGEAPDAGERPPAQAEALRAAREAGQNGSSWAAFAAKRKLPEKVPERYTDAEIREQFHFAALLGAGSLSFASWLFLTRRRHLRGTANAYITARGESIPYDAIETIDLRKWDRGIARIHYRVDDEEVRQTKVDDYQYKGSGAILERALAAHPEIEIEGDVNWLKGERLADPVEDASTETDDEPPSGSADDSGKE